jgi:hypothetical protein
VNVDLNQNQTTLPAKYFKESKKSLISVCHLETSNNSFLLNYVIVHCRYLMFLRVVAYTENFLLLIFEYGLKRWQTDESLADGTNLRFEMISQKNK